MIGLFILLLNDWVGSLLIEYNMNDEECFCIFIVGGFTYVRVK